MSNSNFSFTSLVEQLGVSQNDLFRLQEDLREQRAEVERLETQMSAAKSKLVTLEQRNEAVGEQCKQFANNLQTILAETISMITEIFDFATDLVRKPGVQPVDLRQACDFFEEAYSTAHSRHYAAMTMREQMALRAEADAAISKMWDADARTRAALGVINSTIELVVTRGEDGVVAPLNAAKSGLEACCGEMQTAYESLKRQNSPENIAAANAAVGNVNQAIAGANKAVEGARQPQASASGSQPDTPENDQSERAIAIKQVQTVLGDLASLTIPADTPSDLSTAFRTALAHAHAAFEAFQASQSNDPTALTAAVNAASLAAETAVPATPPAKLAAPAAEQTNGTGPANTATATGSGADGQPETEMVAATEQN